ncbi:ABC transporter permease [Reichenbachiella versicolor]|uniref:ABC transporter permease n=1 Tax=Reichenbachiella versicolor TaxID=1821036 RepID=UPI000D6E2F5F|nr:ABC transporter permease subunit [Reichenbachiella versicolor]
MIRLLELEWLKNKNNLPFWILLGLYGATMYVACSLGTVLMNITFEMTTSGDIPPQIPDFNIYNYPDIWHNLAYLASFVKVFLGIIVISAISNEISQKTLRQNIIDGLSRIEFLGSKFLTVLILSIASTLLLLGLTTYFGMTYGETVDYDTNEKVDFILGHFIQILTFLSFCMFIGMLIKSTGLAIVFMLVWSLFLETFIFWIIFGFENSVSQYMPIHVINDLVQIPFSILNPDNVQTSVSYESITLGLAWTILFFLLSLVKINRGNIYEY